MQTTSLTINGYHGESVPNHLHRQETETDHLALVLPGFGYSCDMPLLYFTVNHLLDCGADVLQVEYRYDQRPQYGVLAPDARQRWLLADVFAAWHSALGQRDYRRFTIVGKSLGTRAMPQLLLHEPSLHAAQTIWFTPVWHDEPVAAWLRQSSQPTLIIIGKIDPLYDETLARDIVTNERCTLTIIPDADHSIEIPGDLIGSVRALEHALIAVQRFTR